jgi:hypothetical protein
MVLRRENRVGVLRDGGGGVGGGGVPPAVVATNCSSREDDDDEGGRSFGRVKKGLSLSLLL